MRNMNNATQYIEYLFAHLLKCYPFQNDDDNQPTSPSIPIDYWKVEDIQTQRMTMEICTAHVAHVHQMCETNPGMYKWYIQILRREHPLMNLVVHEISRIHCHARKIYRIANEMAIFLSINRNGLIYAKESTSSSSVEYADNSMIGNASKVLPSLDEATEFVCRVRDRLTLTKKVENDHSLLMFVHAYETETIQDIFADCFQDIYVLEFLVWRPYSNLPGWASVHLLKTIYTTKYRDIQDPMKWEVILCDDMDEKKPRLLAHPLLPHPEDLIYAEAPLHKRPKRRVHHHHIMYAEQTSCG